MKIGHWKGRLGSRANWCTALCAILSSQIASAGSSNPPYVDAYFRGLDGYRKAAAAKGDQLTGKDMHELYEKHFGEAKRIQAEDNKAAVDRFMKNFRETREAMQALKKKQKLGIKDAPLAKTPSPDESKKKQPGRGVASAPSARTRDLGPVESGTAESVSFNKAASGSGSPSFNSPSKATSGASDVNAGAAESVSFKPGKPGN